MIMSPGRQSFISHISRAQGSHNVSSLPPFLSPSFTAKRRRRLAKRKENLICCRGSLLLRIIKRRERAAATLPHRNKNELTRDFSLRLLSRDILKSYLFARALRLFVLSRRKVTAKSRPRPFFFRFSVSQSLSFFRPPPFSLPPLSFPPSLEYFSRSFVHSTGDRDNYNRRIAIEESVSLREFRVSLIKGGCKGVRREYQEVAIAGPVWHRMEKGRGPRDE